MALVYILNGPDLDMPCVRDASVCGMFGIEAVEGPGRSVAFRQTNREGAPHDATGAVSLPVIQLPLSNLFARESVRHRSRVSPAAKGVLCGFGPKGYELALEALASGGSAHRTTELEAPRKSKA